MKPIPANHFEALKNMSRKNKSPTTLTSPRYSLPLLKEQTISGYNTLP